jgi:ribosomal protein S17
MSNKEENVTETRARRKVRQGLVVSDKMQTV